MNGSKASYVVCCIYFRNFVVLDANVFYEQVLMVVKVGMAMLHGEFPWYWKKLARRLFVIRLMLAVLMFSTRRGGALDMLRMCSLSIFGIDGLVTVIFNREA